MGETTANLRRKIDSAGDLQTVVRTMKAMAASSIGQYENSVLALADYNRTVELGLVACFRATGPIPSIAARFQIKRDERSTNSVVAAIVFGSDQGLVGEFNDVIAQHAVKSLASISGRPLVWAIGERVHSRLIDADLPLAGHFSVPNSVKAITPLVGQILLARASHRDQDDATELYLFYNRPTFGAAYEPVSLRLLPLDDRWYHKLSDAPWPNSNLPEVIGGQTATLRSLIHEYLFVSVFRACAESLASENASRLAAMQRADKNIDELLETLTATFHRRRQSGIDEELFDVVSGFGSLVARSSHDRN